MGDSPWGYARRQKKKQKQKMMSEYEREFQYDDEERYYGKDKNSK